MPEHNYYYKILDAAPEQPLPDTLPLSDLDKKDGFIHLSTAQQTPVTADLFFSKCTKLWLLKIRVKDLDGEIRFVPELPGCPHVHDSKKGLGNGNVESIIIAEKNGGPSWKAVAELATLQD
ncbi:hypothetical protein AC578_1962 [Pseudocercospora eumusae]|uniref:DUF952 domain-containing protein n=1 Tax=Pseudocercospora eumusae TaxID=321146 RepID=A0A139H2G5_9PEZI|nr:hypothetical protein AC578_1962 [Pseudocercospora eumusae]